MAEITKININGVVYDIEVSYIDLADNGATTTSTSGTITNEQLTILQSSKQNCIIFDNQIYRLQDNEHNSGVLTYTYVGYDTEMVSKTITITISTLAWALTELKDTYVLRLDDYNVLENYSTYDISKEQLDSISDFDKVLVIDNRNWELLFIKQITETDGGNIIYVMLDYNLHFDLILGYDEQPDFYISINRNELINVDSYENLVRATPTDITYNADTKVAQLTHDGVAIGTGAVIELDGFTPYFDDDTLVLNDVNELESDIAELEQETIEVFSWFTEQTETYASGIVPEEYRDIERFKKALLSATLGNHKYIFRFNESFQNHTYVFVSNLEEDMIFYITIFNDTWEIQFSVRSYQQKLESSTNIKTINNESILGSGNITISGGLNETEVQTLIDNAIGTTLQGDY